MADELSRGQKAAATRRERELAALERERELGRLETRAASAEDAARRAAASPGRSTSNGSPVRAASTTASTAREASAGAFAGNQASKVQARKLVLVMVAVLFALNIYHETKGQTKVGFYKRVWATGFVGLMLAILADFAPGIAGPLALVVVLSQLPEKGNDLFLSKLKLPTGLQGPQGTPQPQRPAGAPPGVVGPIGG